VTGEGKIDKPNYKASSHRLRSSLRNDKQGRRIKIEGKDCERGGDRPGRRSCVGKEHHRDIIHLQGIILLLAGSQKVRARARTHTLCILFLLSLLSFFHSSSSFSPSFFFIRLPEKSRCGIAATIVQRTEGERKIQEHPREQRSCDRGSSTPRTEAR